MIIVTIFLKIPYIVATSTQLLLEARLAHQYRVRYCGLVPGFFYNLGKLVGPKLRKGKWVWNSLTASQDEIIRAEFEVGRDMAAALVGQMPLDEDLATAGLVVSVGQRLASRLTDRRRKWAFHLVRSASANAFALPGGFIFITRPLIDLCGGNPEEIAFILGHEMGHVIRGHAFDRLLSSTLLTAASAAAPVGKLVTPNVIRIGGRLMQSAYSQDQELEADSFGARLTASAGLNPAAAIRTMQRLQSQHASQLPEVFAWFSTHPPFPTRIVHLRKTPGVG